MLISFKGQSNCHPSIGRRDVVIISPLVSVHLDVFEASCFLSTSGGAKVVGLNLHIRQKAHYLLST